MLAAGKFRRSSTRKNSAPTAPVAPTIATLYSFFTRRILRPRLNDANRRNQDRHLAQKPAINADTRRRGGPFVSDFQLPFWNWHRRGEQQNADGEFPHRGENRP